MSRSGPAHVFLRNPVAGPTLGLLLLVAFNAVADLAAGRSSLLGPGAFLHIALVDGVPAGATIDVLNYGALIAILALGMAPVIATRGVDLSVGSIMAVSAAVAATHVVGGGSATASIALALGAAVACGLWNGLLVAALGLQPFVATLVLMVAGRGIAQILTESQIITFHDPILEYIGLGRPTWLPLPFPFLLAAGLLGLAVLAKRRTAVGLFVESVGGNPEAARLAGVRSSVVTVAVYGFSGFCAGLAGLIAAANIKAADPFNTGRNLELAAIFAVVVGGTSLSGGRFSLVGAFVGAMLMQCLTTTMYARNIGADVAPLPQALVILGVCILGAGPLHAWLARRRAAA